MTNEEKTNEQKAARLDKIASHFIQIGQKDAPLLREAAAMMRERGAVQWEQFGSGAATIYLRRLIVVQRWLKSQFRWDVNERDSDMLGDVFGYADTLEAAQAAAIAWVDEQEGKDV